VLPTLRAKDAAGSAPGLSPLLSQQHDAAWLRVLRGSEAPAQARSPTRVGVATAVDDDELALDLSKKKKKKKKIVEDVLVGSRRLVCPLWRRRGLPIRTGIA
jgi:hypothetical protein